MRDPDKLIPSRRSRVEGTFDVVLAPSARRAVAISGALAVVLAAVALACSRPPGSSRPPTALAAGEAFACARRGGVAKCWGANFASQLGDGTRIDRPTPVLNPALDAKSASEFALGGGHACAIDPKGSLACWGTNYAFQRGWGRNPKDPKWPPRTLPIDEVTSIALGGAHSCAIRRDGHVWCWGRNNRGELGDGLMTARQEPHVVPNVERAVEIALGDEHSCARLEDGSVMWWGGWASGPTGPLFPRPVAGLRGAKQVAAGDRHACARVEGGRVACWDPSGFGMPGVISSNFDGPERGRHNDPGEPRFVPDIADAIEIAVGGSHACAIRAGGTVWCWGTNEKGQLGNGTTELPTAPVLAVGIHDARHLALGAEFSCAMSDEDIHCWGDNENGALGDGTTESRLLPTRVAW